MPNCNNNNNNKVCFIGKVFAMGISIKIKRLLATMETPGHRPTCWAQGPRP